MKNGRVTSLLYCRSALPGRERWDVANLRGKPFLAQQLESELHCRMGIIEVKANAMTGRILLVFDQQVLNNTAELLREVIDHFVARIDEKLLEARHADPKNRQDFEHQDNESILDLIRSVEHSSTLRWKATGLTSLSTIFSLTPPITLGLIMATAVSGGLPFLSGLGLSQLGQIGLLSGVFVGANMANTFSEYHAKMAWQQYASTIEHELRVKAYSHVQHLDMAYLDHESSGQILSVIHDDSVKIREFLGQLPDSVIDRLTTFVLGGLFLIYISPVSFLLSLVPLPVMMFIYRRYHKQIAKRYMEQGEKQQAMRKLLSNNLSGMPTIKGFSREDYEQQRLMDSSSELQHSTTAAFADAMRYADITKFAMVAGLGLPIIYAGSLMIMGKISVTVFMLQSFIMPKMIGAMGGLDHDYDLYQSSTAASKRLSQILSVQPKIRNGAQHIDLASVHGDLRFEEISFSYPGANELFENFHLHIPARSSVALVGTTGSGKSTLTRLLLRFYEINGGRVLLDEMDICDLDFNDLRQVIGLVSQDVFLFHGTIYENIHYGRLDATMEEVMAAAKMAEALHFIEALPDGFDTIVGERGQMLSGGQRQRISIARVILKNPPILILDEATSSVDNETEAAIQHSISLLAKDRSTIVIAHRLSTVRHLDQLYLIDHGQVIEAGTHEQLLEMDKTYAALWKLQMGERPEAQGLPTLASVHP
uniref:CalU n=1 Tax=uncultured Candidatus Entotheonella sp. TaxID=312019 RepID=A0A068PC30_9BACT|nr:CalU [uncultured Candidatus Entotheonella sp.]